MKNSDLKLDIKKNSCIHLFIFFNAKNDHLILIGPTFYFVAIAKEDQNRRRGLFCF